MIDTLNGRQYKAIGFDMDGTLLDTSIDYDRLGTAEYDVMIELGIPPSEIDRNADEIRMIRDGVRYLTANGKQITCEELSKMVNDRYAAIELEAADSAECIRGAEELLIRLKKEGYPIGLLTRGQRCYAESAMSNCGLLKYMDAVDAFDDHPTGEQKPNPIAMDHLAEKLGVTSKDILYIGDSVWDYYCARDSGAGFIGVASGKYGHRKWDALEDDITIVESIADIRDILFG